MTDKEYRDMMLKEALKDTKAQMKGPWFYMLTFVIWLVLMYFLRWRT